MGLLPVKLPGSKTLHSLTPSYWIPTDCTNRLSISDLKSYSGFFGASRKSLSSFTLRDSQGQKFTIKTSHILTLITLISMSSRRITHILLVYIDFFHQVWTSCSIPSRSLHPLALWTQFPSVHPKYDQTRDIYWPPQDYYQTRTPLIFLYYYQGKLSYPSHQFLHITFWAGHLPPSWL